MIVLLLSLLPSAVESRRLKGGFLFLQFDQDGQLTTGGLIGLLICIILCCGLPILSCFVGLCEACRECGERNSELASAARHENKLKYNKLKYNVGPDPDKGPAYRVALCKKHRLPFCSECGLDFSLMNELLYDQKYIDQLKLSGATYSYVKGFVTKFFDGKGKFNDRAIDTDKMTVKRCAAESYLIRCGDSSSKAGMNIHQFTCLADKATKSLLYLRGMDEIGSVDPLNTTTLDMAIEIGSTYPLNTTTLAIASMSLSEGKDSKETYGITVCRNKDGKTMITDIVEGSIAWVNGQLRKGMEIIFINGVHCNHLECNRIKKLLSEFWVEIVAQFQVLAPGTEVRASMVKEFPHMPVGISMKGSCNLIIGIRKGTLAYRQSELHAGLEIMSVNGVVCSGKTGIEVMNMLSSAPRSLSIRAQMPVATQARAISPLPRPQTSTTIKMQSQKWARLLKSWRSAGNNSTANLEQNTPKDHQHGPIPEDLPAPRKNLSSTKAAAIAEEHRKGIGHLPSANH